MVVKGSIRERERNDVEAACVGKYCKQEMGSSVDGSAGGVRSLSTVVIGRSQEAVAVGGVCGTGMPSDATKDLVDAFGACRFVSLYLMAGKSQSMLYK